MDDAKEKPTGVVAYLSYVRVGAGVPDEVRRQIAKFGLVHFVVDFDARTHCCCNVH